MALILSSFMAGLALGNALAACSKIRRWRPLHLYAVLEVLVAFFGCTVVFGLPVLGEWMRPVWQTLWNYQPTLLGLRFNRVFPGAAGADDSNGLNLASVSPGSSATAS